MPALRRFSNLTSRLRLACLTPPLLSALAWGLSACSLVVGDYHVTEHATDAALRSQPVDGSPRGEHDGDQEGDAGKRSEETPFTEDLSTSTLPGADATRPVNDASDSTVPSDAGSTTVDSTATGSDADLPDAAQAATARADAAQPAAGESVPTCLSTDIEALCQALCEIQCVKREAFCVKDSCSLLECTASASGVRACMQINNRFGTQQECKHLDEVTTCEQWVQEYPIPCAVGNAECE